MTQRPTLNPETEFVAALRGSGMRARGWDLLIPFAHAVLESGMFQNELARNANNPFSVKAFKDWAGAIYTLQQSPEWQGDKVVYYPVDYRKYSGMDTALLDYENKIQSIYPRAYENRGNANAYYYGLINIKDGIPVYPCYCPHAEYPDDVLKVYNNLKKDTELYQLITGV